MLSGSAMVTAVPCRMAVCLLYQAAGAIGPTLRDTGGSPHFMHVATHVVDERSEFGGQTDVRRVYGMGFILGVGHDYGNNC